MQECIKKFAERMQFKLDKNKHKECPHMNPDGKGRGWNNCDIRWLLGRIEDEAKELGLALDGGVREEIMDEAAGVGNFAMMIFDNVRNNS